MTAFKASIGFTLLATGSCSSRSRSRPQADKGYEVCRNPLKWNTPGCINLFKNMNKEDSSETSFARIINGDNVSFGEYPWFAKPLNSFGVWYGCGAMLVSPEWVLTAAHCLEDVLTTRYQIGAVCQNSSNCGESSETLKVAERISHPSYDKNTFDNDFALVKLVERASITPVDMDLDGAAKSYNSNAKLWAIGFGDTDPGEAKELPTQMRHVEVSYVSQATCTANYAALQWAFITNNMMCAADPGEDSCQGDSGGPLYDAVDNLLVGVVSWGYGCAETGYPGVYSKIYSQVDWIKSTICENHSTPVPSFCAGYTAPPTPAPTTASPTVSMSPTSLCVPNFIDAYGDDCSWYSAPNLCSEWGYVTGTGIHSDLTANQACCDCNGGTLTSEPAPPPTTASPTVSMSPTSSCVDVPDFIDAYGDGCSFYSTPEVCSEWGYIPGSGIHSDLTVNQACCNCNWGTLNPEPAPVCNDWSSWLDNYGDGCFSYNTAWCGVSEQYTNEEGVDANDACCVCGGGDIEDDPVDVPSGETCNDLPSWTDEYGDDCSWYPEFCDLSQYYADIDGVGATEACCVCGGGEVTVIPLDESCMDSPNRFLINKKSRSCNFVAKKPSVRCLKPGVASHCPETCGLCSKYKCADSEKKWLLQNGNQKKCGWVGKKKTAERCAMEGVQETCRATCGQCNLE